MMTFINFREKNIKLSFNVYLIFKKINPCNSMKNILQKQAN